jgi:spore maturation protein CgeB
VRVLIINTDYPAFLRKLYGNRAGLAEASFAHQMMARNASFFGVFDAYSKGFEANGHEGWEVHANNGHLQQRWMTEAGKRPSMQCKMSARLEFLVRRLARFLPLPFDTRNVLRSPFDIAPWRLPDILLEQARSYQPDVILNQSVSEVGSDILELMRPYTRLIVGQIASPMPDDEDYRAYDLMISSLPNFVEHYRKLGIRSELNRLAFDRRVLDAVGSPARDVEVSFVGSLSLAHPARAELIESLAERTELSIWGNGLEQFASDSPVNRCYHGESWGVDMFTVLARSKITINNHIGIAENFANNMRLYEATGMGSLLISDLKSNIADMFEPGKEIVCYQSTEECLDLIRHYRKNDIERQRIAAAGQWRTLADHSYESRTAELVRLFMAHLR